MSKLNKFSHQLRDMYNYVDEMELKYLKYFVKKDIMFKKGIINNDLELPSIESLFDEKVIATAKYQIIGFIEKKILENNDFMFVWRWSWSIPDVNKNKIIVAKKIFNYATDFFADLTKFEDRNIALEIKTMLITSTFTINKFQLHFLIRYCIYISKYKISLTEQSSYFNIYDLETICLLTDIEIK